MTKNIDRGEFTKGSTLSNILRISIPMIFAMLINVLYNIVDRIYIGHIESVGSLALTGIGLVFPVTVVVSAFQRLFSDGSRALFAIARGDGDNRLASLYMNNAFTLLSLSGIILTVVSYAVKEPMLWLIGADESTFVYANDYLSVYLLGTFFVTVSLGMNQFINAQGYSGIGMATVLIGAVVNIILDPVFIFVFGMGVKGAALASVISQGVSFLWSVLFLAGRKISIPLKITDMKLEPKLCAKAVALGVAGFTMSATTSIVSMIYNSSLQALGGTSWVTSMTIVNSVREIVMLFPMGFTGGAQPVIGYNYGAKQYGRVKSCARIITVACLTYMIAAWAVIMLFPGVFVRIFLSSGEYETILPVAVTTIRIYFSLTFLMTFQVVGQTMFSALGLTKRAIFFSLLRKAILVIPLAFALPHLFGLGVRGVLLSEPISDLLGATTCYVVMMLTVYRKMLREETR